MQTLGKLFATAALLAGALVAVGAAAIATGATPASAVAGAGCTGFNAGGSGWAIFCGNPGSSTTGGGGTVPEVCNYYSLPEAVKAGLVSSRQAAKYKAPSGFIYLVQNCVPSFAGNPAVLLFTNGGQLTTQTLANQAYGLLAPPQLVIDTAPPSGQKGLVGLPEWFWVNPAGYHTLTRTITLDGLSATVTATPGPLMINPGNGQAPFSCPGPGTPYNTAEPASSQHSDCTYLYTQSSQGQPGNAYTVTVSVTWTATWTGSDGAGGTLAPITRAITIDVPIAQAETVIGG